jgi:predicted ATPase
VLLRISRLPEETAAVARSVAVLGKSSNLPAVAALSGLDEAAVARAVAELARADVLRTDEEVAAQLLHAPRRGKPPPSS